MGWVTDDTGEGDPDQDPAAGDGDSGELAYELDDWAVEARELLQRLLTSQGVDHAWEGGTLVIPVEVEDAVDMLIGEVEVTTLPRLDPDAEKVVYEVGLWSDAHRAELAAALGENGVPYEWDRSGDLVIHASDEEAAEKVLDAMDVPDIPDEEDTDGRPANEVLTELFVAADRLRKNARHPDSVLTAVDAAAELEDTPMPFGFERNTWSSILQHARDLRRSFEEDEEEDEVIVEQAASLRDLLHLYV